MMFAAGTAAILAEFPMDVMDYVTDPRTGLPGRLKWPPQPSEVREACEARVAELERAREIGRLGRLKVTPPPPREPLVLGPNQFTYAEVVKRGIRPIGRFERAPSSHVQQQEAAE